MFGMMCSFQTMFNEDYNHWFLKCSFSSYIRTYPLTMSNGLTFRTFSPFQWVFAQLGLFLPPPSGVFWNLCLISFIIRACGTLGNTQCFSFY